MSEIKLLVSGARDWPYEKVLVTALDDIALKLKEKKLVISELVEGGAKGADTMARNWAKTCDLKINTFNADWKKFGKAAGPIRNTAMVKYVSSSGIVVAFHSDITKSKGALSLVGIAKKHNLTVWLVNHKGTISSL